MTSLRLFQLYSIVLLYLATSASAWPWPRWLPELDSLIVRQNNGNNTASPSQTGSTAQQTGTDLGPVITGSSNPQPTGSASGKNGNQTSATVTHHTSYDPRLPAGGVSMMTPAVASGPTYFKIGDFVTLGWSYTSLEATPTAVNVMATCTANQQLYTIQMNQTVANNTGAVVWDTGSYQATAVTDPLLTETYTLIIYDADSSISATAQAGYLAVYNQYTFGMYTPQAYTPLGEFKCVTCSGALSAMERRALGLVLAMGTLTVLSGLWFVNGLGIVW